MDRTKAFMKVMSCVPLLMVGLIMLIAGLAMEAFRMMALGLVLSIFAIVRMVKAGEDFRAGRKPKQTKVPPVKPRGKTAPRGTSLPLRGNDRPGSPRAAHDHIQSTELSHDRKMEQLRTLKEAGLLTQEEYDERYQKILKGR